MRWSEPLRTLDGRYEQNGGTSTRLGETTGHRAQALPEGLLLLLGLKGPSERANPGNAREITDLIGFGR